MEGMNIILSLDNYNIYSSNKYYLCIPNKYNQFYHVFMGFPTRNLTDLSKEELIKEIRHISDSINASYKNGIYILPIISTYKLTEASNENEDRSYNKILNNVIQPITYEAYNLFTKNNIHVNHTINMIIQNDIDKKLIDWLSIKLGPNFIKEITFDKNNYYKENNNNKITTNYDNSSIFLDYEKEALNENNQEPVSDVLKAATSPGFGRLGAIIMLTSIFSIFSGIILYMILK